VGLTGPDKARVGKRLRLWKGERKKRIDIKGKKKHLVRLQEGRRRGGGSYCGRNERKNITGRAVKCLRKLQELQAAKKEKKDVRDESGGEKGKKRLAHWGGKNGWNKEFGVER